MKKARHPWTPEEDRLLLSLVEKHHDPEKQRNKWNKIAPHFQRTERGIAQRYYILRKIPKQLKLDIPSRPIQTPLRKRSMTKKSFLWGLYTVTREE